MARTVGIGIQDFRTIIEENCFYVDKTDFIRELLRGDKKGMNAYMNRVALNTFSYFDTGKIYYHFQQRKWFRQI